MKNRPHPLLALLTALAAFPAAALLAQDAAAPAATPAVSAPAATDSAPAGGKMKGRAELTSDEKAKLKAARRTAMSDPAVKAAEAGKTSKEGKHAYRKALDEAMIKADPSVAPILEKMKAHRGGRKGEKKGSAFGEE